MDMRQRVATIDLGDLSVPPRPPPPDRASPAVLRGVRLMAVVLLVLAAAAGATTGAAHLVNPLWTRAASLAGFVVGGRVVAMSDPGANAVLGLDPDTGALRWRLELPAPPQYIYSTGAGVIGIVVRDVNAADDDSRVTLLVTESGTILTRMPGNQVSLIATTSLLLAETGQGSVTVGCPADAEVCTDVAAFDVAAERQVWRRALPGLVVPSQAGPRGPLTRFATVRASGLVEIRDPATGDVAGLLRPELPDAGVGSVPRLLMLGDTVLSATRGPGQADMRAHPYSAGAPSGAVTLRSTGEGGLQFYLAGCGRYVCLHLDGHDTVFDAGLRPVGHPTEHQVVRELGPYLLAVPSFERAGTPQSRRTVYLIPRDGRGETVTLADTSIVRWHDSDGQVLLARQGVFGTTFTLLDRLGVGHLLGTVPGTDQTCEASRAVLVCANPIGSVRTWNLSGLLTPPRSDRSLGNAPAAAVR